MTSQGRQKGAGLDSSPVYSNRGAAHLHGDQGGAVIMLSLAGMLLILLAAMMAFDASMATKEKAQVQSAADFSALSQASIKARSMNMLAYANIAKRSIWAIHSLYPAHIHAYRNWIFNGLRNECEWDSDEQSWEIPSDSLEGGEGTEAGEGGMDSLDRCQMILDNLDNYVRETGTEFGQSDFMTFSGGDFSDHHRDTVEFPPYDELVPTADGISVRYYARDLQALDNYQRFILGATPWWGWTEHLLIGMRNGASVSASFPPPPAGLDSSFFSFSELENIVGQPQNQWVNRTERLPVRPWSSGGETMSSHITSQLDGLTMSGLTNNPEGAAGTHPFRLEHIANNARLVSQSDASYQCVTLSSALDADCNVQLRLEMLQMAWYRAPITSFLSQGLDYSRAAFSMGDVPEAASQPFLMESFADRSHWLTASSNLVFTFLQDHEEIRRSGAREKYQFVGEDPMLTEQFFEQADDGGADARQRRMYEAVGYWGMARAEIAFIDPGQPDLWHPAWTSRLRPVSLPGEFADQQIQMRGIFHTVLPYFRLAQEMGLTDFDGVEHPRHAWDFARMEWMMRSLSQATIEGLPK